MGVYCRKNRSLTRLRLSQQRFLQIPEIAHGLAVLAYQILHEPKIYGNQVSDSKKYYLMLFPPVLFHEPSPSSCASGMQDRESTGVQLKHSACEFIHFFLFVTYPKTLKKGVKLFKSKIITVELWSKTIFLYPNHGYFI